MTNDEGRIFVNKPFGHSSLVSLWPKWFCWCELGGMCLVPVDDAITAFENALANTKKRKMKGRYYYELGEARKNAGKYSDAISAYNDCLKFTTEAFFKGGANFGKGESYTKIGQKSNAIIV